MPTIIDDEFGTISIRRSPRASHVSIRVAPNGTLRASLPLYAPVFMLKRLIKNSRNELRKLMVDQQPAYTYENGMQIGKSHTLVVVQSTGDTTKVVRHQLQIIAHLAAHHTIDHPVASRAIRDAVITALRKEAKSYLPKRLAFLATKLGFSYERVRFSHASGRWGSCSSNGTISLNIALMKLPHELIDYVLVHELSHTVQMNHSPQFWATVERGDPSYSLHRNILKQHTPSV